jgi:GNAT superfamily N-acetyltransferase
MDNILFGVTRLGNIHGITQIKNIIKYMPSEDACKYETHINDWLFDSLKLLNLCVVNVSDGSLKCFALISQKFKNSWFIDFIYTYPSYRNKGYASELLNELKKKYELEAICTTGKLFDKNDFNKNLHTDYYTFP